MRYEDGIKFAEEKSKRLIWIIVTTDTLSSCPVVPRQIVSSLSKSFF